LTRVLFLTESFHPVLGGGEQHILRLSRRLVAAGMPATVVTRQSEAAWPREESLGGVRVLRVPPAGGARSGKYKMVPAALCALFRERKRYDVLIVRGTRVLGLPGLLAARALGKPVVLQAEVNGEMSGEVFTWGRLATGSPGARLVRAAFAARNVLVRDADCFVAMSRRIAGELAEAGVPNEKVALVPHGVDTARFRPAEPVEKLDLRRRLGLPAGAVVVSYAGRLLRGKGLETLVEAYAAARATEPRLLLLLVGSGAGQSLSIEAELRERVQRDGLDAGVRFAGQADNVDDFLRASDIFALPSVFEALGLALVEAAACGLACIGTRTGGIVDVIEDGRSGLLIEPDDTAGLTRALLRLASDAGLRERLGAAARAHACARFDEQDAAAAYSVLFRELHARGLPGRRAQA
jgi:glycosyltransferase involved in cell wall biosynthesis